VNQNVKILVSLYVKPHARLLDARLHARLELVNLNANMNVLLLQCGGTNK